MRESHRERAEAKLTRTLRIEGRRGDGYHLLRAEMVSLDLADELEIRDGDGLEVVDAVAWAPAPARARIAPVPDGDENLVRQALERAGRRAFVRLTKKIPHGAGLGGGSSDAAAILRWAGLDEPAVAVGLGADVPFCLRGGRAVVTGIGEVVAPLEDEPGAFVLATPDVAVSTAAVYAAFDELGVGDRGHARNDLERAALAVEPSLATVRDALSGATDRRAQLAGSGSTFFVECTEAELAGLVERAAAGLSAAGLCACVTGALATGRVGRS